MFGVLELSNSVDYCAGIWWLVTHTAGWWIVKTFRGNLLSFTFNFNIEAVSSETVFLSTKLNGVTSHYIVTFMLNANMM
jgi:hypothetical protein